MREIVVGLIFVAVTGASLVSAALSDLRSREASDLHWYAVCAMGILTTIALVMPDRPSIAVTRAMGIAILTVYMLSQRIIGSLEPIFLVIGSALFLIPGAFEGDWSGLRALLPFLLFLLMYTAGVIRGGADAKALMSLALTLPSTCMLPLGSGGPTTLPLVFPIALLALLMSLLFCIPVLSASIRQGCPSATCYRIPIDRVRTAHVWPVEDVVDGIIVEDAGLNDAEGRISRLRDAGATDVLVTPMVPFLVPLCAAFIVVVILPAVL